MIVLRDRLIVTPDKAKDIGSDGLVTIAVETIRKGIVQEVGTTVKDVQKGDHIMYSPFHYDMADETNIIIAEEDVWAVLNR